MAAPIAVAVFLWLVRFSLFSDDPLRPLKHPVSVFIMTSFLVILGMVMLGYAVSACGILIELVSARLRPRRKD
jgi:hypothetical protein